MLFLRAVLANCATALSFTQHGYKKNRVTKKTAAKSRPAVKEKLRQTASKSAAPELGSRIHARFAALSGVHLPVPDRKELPLAAKFDL